MPVKIRLARRGRKKKPIYSIVVTDSRAPRDGRFIEKIGQYNPHTNPAGVTLKTDRALYRLMTGAQPTETVRSILSKCGMMYRKHLQVGVAKSAITQEQADERYEVWAKERGGTAAQIFAQNKSEEVPEIVEKITEEEEVEVIEKATTEAALKEEVLPAEIQEKAAQEEKIPEEKPEESNNPES